MFIANGESDPMILPRFSYLLAGLIPGAMVKIYPTLRMGSYSSTMLSLLPT